MSFIENIRQSDRRTKLRYVIIFSGIAGIVAVGIWAMTVRSILESVTSGNIEETTKKSAFSFTSSISSAWSGLKENTQNTFEFFKEKITEENEITIKNNN